MLLRTGYGRSPPPPTVRSPLERCSLASRASVAFATATFAGDTTATTPSTTRPSGPRARSAGHSRPCRTAARAQRGRLGRRRTDQLDPLRQVGAGHPPGTAHASSRRPHRSSAQQCDRACSGARACQSCSRSAPVPVGGPCHSGRSAARRTGAGAPPAAQARSCQWARPTTAAHTMIVAAGLAPPQRASPTWNSAIQHRSSRQRWRGLAHRAVLVPRCPAGQSLWRHGVTHPEAARLSGSTAATRRDEQLSGDISGSRLGGQPFDAASKIVSQRNDAAGPCPTRQPLDAGTSCSKMMSIAACGEIRVANHDASRIREGGADMQPWPEGEHLAPGAAASAGP